MWETIEQWRGQIESRAITSSVVAGLILSGLAAMGDLPLWGIALTGLAGFSILPWGLIGWRKLRELRYRTADFEKWDRVEIPALWQAACLYDDREPYIPVAPGTPCYSTLQMLKSAIMSGQITKVDVFGGSDAMVRLRREDIRRFAESRGDRPLSFFPDAR